MRYSIRSMLVAVVAVSLAWANKRPALISSKGYVLHRYAWASMSFDATKYYISMDVTSNGLIKGLDYQCNYSYAICTFAADPQKIHIDNTGTWFYISDVPSSGIDYSGSFFLIDY